MNKFEYKNLTPFKWFVLENFPFIEADFDALTEWQLFCKLGKEMNKIINSENTLGTQVENVTNAFIKLQNYVNNYFDNLDVQEEINNKLNEMATDGTLSTLIGNYVNNFVMPTINTIQNQVNSLASGSPLAANSIKEMTDTSRVYVNTTDGHWYWYNGTTWIDGGVYQASVNPDFDSLKDLVIDTFYDYDNNFSVDWDQGAVNLSGSNQSSDITIRTNKYIKVYKGSKVKPLNSYKMRVAMYSYPLVANFIENNIDGYTTEEYEIPRDCYIKVSLRNSGETSIIPENAENNIQFSLYTTYIKDDVKNNEENIETLLNNTGEYINDSSLWIQGSWDNQTGQVKETINTTRIRTPILPSNIQTIEIKENIMAYILGWDKDNNFLGALNQTTKEFQKTYNNWWGGQQKLDLKPYLKLGYKFALVLAHLNTSTNISIEEGNKVIFYYNSIEELENDNKITTKINNYENGYFYEWSGIRRNSTNFVRNFEFLENSVEKIECKENYLFYLYAWKDKGVNLEYIGVLNNNRFLTEANSMQPFSSIDLKNIKDLYINQYPNICFKIAIFKSDNSEITPEEVEGNVIFSHKLNRYLLEKTNNLEEIYVNKDIPSYLELQSVPFNGSDVLTYNEILAGYDELASLFPENVSKELLGKDQSNTYDIYKYTFTPKNSIIIGHTPYNNAIYKKPKIIIDACIHGGEKPCARAVLNFITLVYKNWKNNKALEYLRNNIEFIIIPVLNPWGYNNGQRVNSRHVDLNRNFDVYTWSTGPDDNTSNNYRGKSPLSEEESKIIDNILSENRDALAYFSMHTHGVFTDYKNMTTFSYADLEKNDGMVRIGYSLNTDVTVSGWKNHELPENSGLIGTLEAFTAAGASCQGQKYGIPSASPEVMYKYFGTDDGFYTPKVNCLNTEYVIDLCLLACRYLAISN